MRFILTKMLAVKEKDRPLTKDLLNLPEYLALLYGTDTEEINNNFENENTSTVLVKTMKNLYNPNLF